MSSNGSGLPEFMMILFCVLTIILVAFVVIKINNQIVINTADLKEIKEDLSNIKDDTSEVKDLYDGILQDLKEVRENLDEISKDVDEIKELVIDK